MFRSPDGPGTIRGKAIRPKAISANHIAVSDLESVNASTGNLSVTGNIAMTAAGSFSAGQTDFDTGVGWWLDMAGATPRFSLGNSGSNRLTWDGTTLNIVGTLTATTGQIGGFSIGATDLTTDAGATGLASSGSQRIWVGNATPGSAPFRVSSAGVATMIGAVIGSAASGARVELNPTNGVSVYDSGGTVRGRLLTTGAGYLGSTDGTSATAALSWTTAGVATINASAITTGTLNAGTITVSNLNATNLTTGTLGNGGSGIGLGGTNGLSISGNLTLASGGKIIDADGSYWDQSGITLVSAGAYGDAIQWKVAGTPRGSIMATSSYMHLGYASAGTTDGGYVQLGSTYAYMGGGNGAQISAHNSFGVYAHGKFYPGHRDSGLWNAQTTYYIEGGGGIISNGIGIGGMLGVSSGNTINLIAPGTGGSATNWSGFTSANIPDKSAGYFLIQLGGTAYRVPFYANA